VGERRYSSAHSLTAALDGGEPSPWYTLDRRLGGPHSRSGCGGEEKNSHQELNINAVFWIFRFAVGIMSSKISWRLEGGGGTQLFPYI